MEKSINNISENITFNNKLINLVIDFSREKNSQELKKITESLHSADSVSYTHLRAHET